MNAEESYICIKVRVTKAQRFAKKHNYASKQVVLQNNLVDSVFQDDHSMTRPDEQMSDNQWFCKLFFTHNTEKAQMNSLCWADWSAQFTTELLINHTEEMCFAVWNSIQNGRLTFQVNSSTPILHLMSTSYRTKFRKSHTEVPRSIKNTWNQTISIA